MPSETASRDGRARRTVGDYCLVRQLLCDERLTSTKEPKDALLQSDGRMFDLVGKWPLYSEGLEHRRRRLAAAWKAVSRRAIDAEMIRMADEIARSIAERNSANVDVYSDLALPYARHLAGEILGIHPEDREAAFLIGEEVLAFISKVDGTEIAAASAAEAIRRFGSLRMGSELSTQSRRPSPSLDNDELIAVQLQILTGTYRPVAVGLATAILAIGCDKRLQAIASNPDFVPSIVDECLRFSTPFHIAARRAASDFVVDGLHVSQNDFVKLQLLTANHDASIYANPSTFDPWRWPHSSQHLAFGFGAHACIGSSIATRAIARAIEVFSNLIPSFETILCEYRPTFGMTTFERALISLD